MMDEAKAKGQSQSVTRGYEPSDEAKVGLNHGKSSWDRNIYRAMIGYYVYRTT
jgi:hypothetical protein